jgi:hypothetical protein
VAFEHGFFYLRGQRACVRLRSVREEASLALLARYRRVLRIICALPFTRLVALSGSVAHLNVDPGADLDLFIVTRGARVWGVTLTIVLLTRLLGCRKIVCANYVIADSALAVDQPDLFTANQILHLRPLVGVDLYPAFVAANPFVEACYPGARERGADVAGFAPNRLVAALKRVTEVVLSLGPAQLYERIGRAIYSRHLHARAIHWQSPEQVHLGGEQLKLHTSSHRRAILERFDAQVARVLAEAADAIGPPIRRAASGR